MGTQCGAVFRYISPAVSDSLTTRSKLADEDQLEKDKVHCATKEEEPKFRLPLLVIGFSFVFAWFSQGESQKTLDAPGCRGSFAGAGLLVGVRSFPMKEVSDNDPWGSYIDV
ncbi:MAG TPA: hypothetical protein VNA27_03010 [Rubrobacteraceae bacterium]|nr:hypothetical protein [Rubrobacteraceae bacterium]